MTEIERVFTTIFSDERGQPCPQKLADAQLVLGYTMSDSHDMNTFFVWWDMKGSSGKSLVFKLIQQVTDKFPMILEQDGVAIFGEMRDNLKRGKFNKVHFVSDNIEMRCDLEWRGLMKKAVAIQLHQRFLLEPKGPCEHRDDQGLFERLSKSPKDMKWLSEWLEEGKQCYLRGEETLSKRAEEETQRFLSSEHLPNPIRDFMETLEYRPDLKKGKTSVELYSEFRVFIRRNFPLLESRCPKRDFLNYIEELGYKCEDSLYHYHSKECLK